MDFYLIWLILSLFAFDSYTLGAMLFCVLQAISGVPQVALDPTKSREGRENHQDHRQDQQATCRPRSQQRVDGDSRRDFNRQKCGSDEHLFVDPNVHNYSASLHYMASCKDPVP